MSNEFDLASTGLRILECSQCDEPVSAVAGPRVTLRCGYCGFVDERELTGMARSARTDGDPSHDSAYRARQHAQAARRQRVDLQAPIAGLPRLPKLATLRALYLQRKKELLSPSATADDASRAEREMALLEIANRLFGIYIRDRDWLHARAALETTLEALTLPVYRALTLARLARLAAASNAPELAEKWLDAAPTDLRVAEVESDLTVARAFVARARGAHELTLEILRSGVADGLVGMPRWQAVALRTDALEQLGDPGAALKEWRSAERGFRAASNLGAAAQTYGLAVATRGRSLRRSLLVIVLGLGGIVVLIGALGSLARDAPYGWELLAGVVLLLAVLVVRRR